MRYIYATLLIIAGILFAAGCKSTAPTLADGATPAAVKSDGIEKWERRAYSAANLGTAVYLAKRDDLAPKQREAIRQTWLAFHAIIVSLQADGQPVDVQAALLLAAQEYVTDPALQPLAVTFAQTIIDGVKSQVPTDGLTSSDAWRIAVAVHNGIANSLVLHGVDPTKPVKGSGGGDRT